MRALPGRQNDLLQAERGPTLSGEGDAYPYRQGRASVTQRLELRYVVCSGTADRVPEEYKELAVAPLPADHGILWGQEPRGGRASRRGTPSSGPVVSGGMEVKEIRFDRRKAAAVTVFTHLARRRVCLARSQRGGPDALAATGSIGCASARRRARHAPLPVEKVVQQPKQGSTTPTAGRGASTLFFQGRGASPANEEQILVSKDKMDSLAPYRLRGEGSLSSVTTPRRAGHFRGEVRVAREEKASEAAPRRRRAAAPLAAALSDAGRRASAPGRVGRRDARRGRLGRRRRAPPAQARGASARRPSRASAARAASPRRASRSWSGKRLWTLQTGAMQSRRARHRCVRHLHRSATARLGVEIDGATTTTPPKIG